MNTTDDSSAATRGSALSEGLGGSREQRADDDEPYWDDRDEALDGPECARCRGDGMDPWCDYLMPCPVCQGEQRP